MYLALIDHLTSARANMGLTLAFHIVFASFGVGMPLLMVLAEGIGIAKKDALWTALARKWSKVVGITFAVGAVSGTIVAFEIGLLWPEFMEVAGGIVGLPFTLEGISFFAEAIFIGIYLYGWDRMSPKLHWLCGLPTVVTGITGALLVISANAWMNGPVGFDIETFKATGQVAGVDPLRAMFNHMWATQGPHMIVAAYMGVSFAVAAIYAMGMLRGRRDGYHRRAITLALAVAAIAAPVQIGLGDLLGRSVAQNQPEKLAAQEGLWDAETKGAGLNLIGLPVPGEEKTVVNLKIPKFLSLIAYDDIDAPVKGLNAFPEDDRPELPSLVRFAYILMVWIGMALVGLGIFFWVARRLLGRMPEDRFTLRSLVVAGPLPFVAIWCGWIVTEVGRQPWSIYKVMRTSESVTPSPGLDAFFLGFAAMYVVLSVVTIALARRIATGGPPDGTGAPTTPRGGVA